MYPSLEKFKPIKNRSFFTWLVKMIMSHLIKLVWNLEKYIKNYDLFIADDNHNLNLYKECYPLLRNAFFKYGIGSKELHEAKKSLKCKEWIPK